MEEGSCFLELQSNAERRSHVKGKSKDKITVVFLGLRSREHLRLLVRLVKHCSVQRIIQSVCLSTQFKYRSLFQNARTITWCHNVQNTKLLFERIVTNVTARWIEAICLQLVFTGYMIEVSCRNMIEMLHHTIFLI